MRVLYINTNPSISNKIIDDSYDNGVYYMEKNSSQVSLFNHIIIIIVIIAIVMISTKQRTWLMVYSNIEIRFLRVIEVDLMFIGV